MPEPPTHAPSQTAARTRVLALAYTAFQNRLQSATWMKVLRL